MIPKIVNISTKKLIGLSIQTSLSENRTAELWQQFMPRKKEIQAVDSLLYSIQIYDESIKVGNFTPTTVFEKWAAVEVADFNNVPKGFQTFLLKTGKYAVFIHKGTVQEFPKTMGYILGTWLPKSGFELDDRPHFEVMGDKYLGHLHPDSEEEVWIPIK